ncbi:MAG TPA: ComEA family DNA-binding protein [Gemmatimonadales bacterium]|nr:ComEA family DNA-binding protein [Gemmatimonadales bacterium]
MASSDDRRAAVALLLLALAGLAVRFVTDRTSAPGAVAYRATSGRRPERDSLAVRSARLARPLALGETVDVDRADADELVRLPRVGPAMAARIVADREARGAFGSLDALGRVPGMGPAGLEALRPFAAFSGAPASGPRPEGDADAPPIRVNAATAAELERLPGVGPGLAREIVRDRTRNGPFRTPSDLARVRGIGPGLVERLKGRIVVP